MLSERVLQRPMAVYLDCAATAPVDPRVQQEVMTYLGVEFGNAGSRHHGFGSRARSAVEKARVQVAAVVGATRGEVIFTSGATESNNLALLGLAEYGTTTGRVHVVSTRIEHKSVLEPLQVLSGRGFEVTLVAPEPGGWVHPRSRAGSGSRRYPSGLGDAGQQRDRRHSAHRGNGPVVGKTSRLPARGCRPGLRGKRSGHCATVGST